MAGLLPPPAGRILSLFDFLQTGLVIFNFTNGTFSFKLLTLILPFGVASFTLSLKNSITIFTFTVIDGVNDGPDDPEHSQNQIEGQQQDAKNRSSVHSAYLVNAENLYPYQ